jgi:hypothetical protein
MGVPARKSLPSWFLVADGDQAIPPDAERQFAARMGANTVEVASNHVAIVSHPDEAVERPPKACHAANSSGGEPLDARATIIAIVSSLACDSESRVKDTCSPHCGQLPTSPVNVYAQPQ